MVRTVVRLSRSALSGVFFILYGLFSLPFAPLVPFLPPKAGRLAVRIFYRAFVAAARATGLFTVETSSGRPLPRGRVVVMNHVSLIDICVLLAALPDSVCIAKSSLKRNPFLSMVAKHLFITNDRGWDETRSKASAFIESGINVVVFPQGTRGGATLHRGAARIALAANAPVAPFRISYDPVVLAKGQPWWDVGGKTIRIRLEARPEIAPSCADGRPGAVALTEDIREALFPAVL